MDTIASPVQLRRSPQRRLGHHTLLLAACSSLTLVVGGGLGWAGLGSAAASVRTNASSATARIEMTPVGTAALVPPGASDLGAAVTKDALRLDIVLRPRDPAALDQFIVEVSSPSSPLYRHYLAKGQFGPMFGPTSFTISMVSAELRRTGLDVGAVSGNDLILPVKTTVGKAEKAFGVSVNAFRLSSGTIADANTTAPRLPSVIAPFIQSVVGLDNLGQASPAYVGPSSAPTEQEDRVGSGSSRISPHLAAGQPVACAGAVDTGQSLTATGIAQAYDFEPLYAADDFGGGESVALFEQSNFLGTDVAAYEKCYGIKVPITIVSTDGPVSDNSPETTIDIEDVIGLDPHLKALDVYETQPNNSTDAEEQYSLIASQDSAKVVSTSWSICELGNGSQINAEESSFAVMAAQGQTVFANSGDYGWQCSPGASAQKSVSYPASSPFVTGVGGTELASLGNPPLTAPSESGWPASGGGISSVWYMPFAWQKGKGVINPFSSGTPCGNKSGYCREVPDVSADAGGPSSFYAMYFNGVWQGAGGTSLATPTWAALAALMDASSPSCAKHPVGFLNPALYALAASTPHDFNDVTTGGASKGSGYPVTPGYDLVTGLGSPEGANLAQSLCAQTFWTPQATATSTYLTNSPSLASYRNTLYAASIDAYPPGTPSPIFYETWDTSRGTTWGGFSTVRPGGKAAVTAVPPSIAINNGTPAVAWTDSNTGKVEVSSLIQGKWSSPVVVGAGTALSNGGPAMTAYGGSLFIAWKGSTTRKVYISVNSGKGWDASQQVTGANTDVRPAITFYPQLSALVIAWSTSTDKVQYEVFSLFGFGGVATIPAAGSNVGPALAVAGGELYAAWKGTDSDKVLFSSEPAKELYGTWRKQQTVSEGLTLDSPALAVVGSTLFAAWTGKDPGGTSAYLWYSASDVPQ